MGKYDQTSYVKEAKKRYRATTLKATKIKIEVPRELHAEIKAIAEQKDITMIQLLQDSINLYKSKINP